MTQARAAVTLYQVRDVIEWVHWGSAGVDKVDKVPESVTQWSSEPCNHSEPCGHESKSERTVPPAAAGGNSPRSTCAMRSVSGQPTSSRYLVQQPSRALPGHLSDRN